MSSYKVKEMYYTLQGEGGHAGRGAVFLRFSGCNLWSGREEDRHKAICKFCDTDFWGTDGLNGGKFETAESLAAQVKQFWPKDTNGTPYVVCTGGEPMLQLDSVLIDALHAQGFEVAVETNGTILPPPGLDWICVSPKANTTLLITKGNELKLVYPQTGAAPTQFEDLNFEHFFLQPMDGPDIQENTQLTLKYCLSHPKWRLSLQTHKILDIL